MLQPPEFQFSRAKYVAMIERAVIVVFLSAFLLVGKARPDDEAFAKDLDYFYTIETKVEEELKVTTLHAQIKCRARTSDIVACNLFEPKYVTTYNEEPGNKSKTLIDKEHFRPDNSHIGLFEIKYRNSRVERLTVASWTRLKALNLYRIIAGLLFPGVDVTGKPDGTYYLPEESVYGRCQSYVKVVSSKYTEKIEDEDESNIPEKNDDGEAPKSTKYSKLLSIKKTRNLETCSPVPGLLLFDGFFYHPMMTDVHYDIKSSIGRTIRIDKSFMSLTSEGITMRDLRKSTGNVTMLHVETILVLTSVKPAEGSLPPIPYPMSVQLAFIDGINPLSQQPTEKPKISNDTANSSDNTKNHTESYKPSSNSEIKGFNETGNQ